jgi:hypothetical protein
MKRSRVAALACAVIGSTATAAFPVVILDETWAEYGGTRAEPANGFGAHITLAAKSDFSAGFGFWDGEAFTASGTWIGNDSSGSA